MHTRSSLSQGLAKIEVYDSAIQEWTMTSQSLPHGVTCIRGQTAAFCNGFLYCTVDEGIGSKMSGVIAYDTQLAVWSTMLIMLPLGFGEARSSNSLQPRSLSASLVECGGHVMLVAETSAWGDACPSFLSYNSCRSHGARLPHCHLRVPHPVLKASGMAYGAMVWWCMSIAFVFDKPMWRHGCIGHGPK